MTKLKMSLLVLLSCVAIPSLAKAESCLVLSNPDYGNDVENYRLGQVDGGHYELSPGTDTYARQRVFVYDNLFEGYVTVYHYPYIERVSVSQGSKGTKELVFQRFKTFRTRFSLSDLKVEVADFIRSLSARSCERPAAAKEVKGDGLTTRIEKTNRALAGINQQVADLGGKREWHHEAPQESMDSKAKTLSDLGASGLKDAQDASSGEAFAR